MAKQISRGDTVFEKIDSFILAGCTKFSHWLQRLTGLTNYFLANIGTTLTAVAAMMVILNYFHQIFLFATRLFDLIMNLLMLAILLRQSFTCTKAQNKISDGKVALPAELKTFVSGYAWRIFVLALTLFLATTIFLGRLSKSTQGRMEAVNTLIFTLGYCIFWYFIAVVPLPPGINKLHQFLDNLGRRRQGQTA